jgi:hypothetical protein
MFKKALGFSQKTSKSEWLKPNLVLEQSPNLKVGVNHKGENIYLLYFQYFMYLKILLYSSLNTSKNAHCGIVK